MAVGGGASLGAGSAKVGAAGLRLQGGPSLPRHAIAFAGAGFSAAAWVLYDELGGGNHVGRMRAAAPAAVAACSQRWEFRSAR